MKRFAALIVSCSFVTASFGQQALTAGTLQYSVSTLIEHPTMGSGTPKPKKLEIMFTKDSLRVNALYGKSMFQTITACISPQSTQYATNGNKFYVLQLPRTGDVLDIRTWGQAPPIITYTNDTATVQGYACKKAIVESMISDTEKRTMEVWYLPDYQIRLDCFNYFFQDLKGIPVLIRFSEKPRMQADGHRMMMTFEFTLLKLDTQSPWKAIATIDHLNRYEAVSEHEIIQRLMEVGLNR